MNVSNTNNILFSGYPNGYPFSIKLEDIWWLIGEIRSNGNQGKIRANQGLKLEDSWKVGSLSITHEFMYCICYWKGVLLAGLTNILILNVTKLHLIHKDKHE